MNINSNVSANSNISPSATVSSKANVNTNTIDKQKIKRLKPDQKQKAMKFFEIENVKYYYLNI